MLAYLTLKFSVLEFIFLIKKNNKLHHLLISFIVYYLHFFVYLIRKNVDILFDIVILSIAESLIIHK